MRHLRARSALAAAAGATAPGPFLREAERDARRLQGEKMPWSEALAQLIHAGAAARRGDPGRGMGLLMEAAERCEAADMRLYAHAARRCVGERTGGDSGAELVAQTDAWMMGQKVRNPGRMTALLVPGFAREGTRVD
jgi:hypothetical protein